MNKKLIALALAGASIAPAAMAQTANPVTLYGRVWAMFESVEATGGSAPVVRRNRVTDESSLLGVRGTEDLGGGLKAWFQLETSFRPDSNDSTFAARNSGVGLQGGWGSLLLGRWDTPYKATTIAIDPFGDLNLGGWTAAMNGGGLNNVRGEFDIREQNNVQYWSPSWGGFAFRLSYMANESRTAGQNPRSQGGSVTYTGGPVYVGYAYHELKQCQFASTACVTGTFIEKQASNAVFGSFTFGPIKLGAAVEDFKRTNLSKQKAYAGNIVWTIGNNQLIYQYQKTKDGLAAGAAQPDCKVNSAGYQYNFTRRTFFLATYTKIDNNAVGTCNFTVGGGPLTITAGQDPKGFAAGFRHIF